MRFRFHVAAGKDAVALQSLAHHGIPLSTTGKAYLRGIFIIHPEQSALRIEHNAFAGKETTKTAVQRKILRRTDSYPIRLIHQPDFVGNLQSQFKIVRREKNSLVRPSAEVMQQLHHFHFAGKVEESGRLIQINHRRLMSQRFGYHHFLTFAVAQRMHHAVCQMRDADQSNGVFHHMLVLLCQHAPKTCIRGASQPHQFRNGHIAEVALLRQHHTDDA